LTPEKDTWLNDILPGDKPPKVRSSLHLIRECYRSLKTDKPLLKEFDKIHYNMLKYDNDDIKSLEYSEKYIRKLNEKKKKK